MGNGELDDGAIALNEMFESYIRARFTRREALELIKVHLAKVIEGRATDETT